ncbi:thiamine pyrophosphokinase [Blattabacterium sp. (Mastotermes darwiniensis) str. MADAR]|uniref:thiamine diphosphokinase n=1 Tax=Blattabacterium sp. (Mastotermes darwiniensis) TaxID=39768 RepID=UPI000231DF40|nr:thiamine diphosphokinase [Blattabacterium sp. (Mastotermes darwiniensis)]AER40349.1 thiamine pyrophosphokinase [Blattabacterium sp. (Mastotermes darwiniensis) str. MADAR]
MNHRFIGPEVELFLNGNPPNIVKNKYFFYGKKIFAVDGAFYYLKKMGIKVDFISGDFDSILKKDLPLKDEVFETNNQDITDFDKALRIIHHKGFLNVNVWGAGGREQDHFLGNLSTALKYKKKLSLIFHDDYHSYFFSNKKTFFYQKKNKIISLFPFPKVEGLLTYGLKYPINDESFQIGKRIGIRNKAIESKIKIIYKKGELLIFLEK